MTINDRLNSGMAQPRALLIQFFFTPKSSGSHAQIFTATLSASLAALPAHVLPLLTR